MSSDVPEKVVMICRQIMDGRERMAGKVHSGSDKKDEQQSVEVVPEGHDIKAESRLLKEKEQFLMQLHKQFHPTSSAKYSRPIDNNQA